MVQLAVSHNTDSEDPIYTFVMPVLLINGGTLWTVDYSEEGYAIRPLRRRNRCCTWIVIIKFAFEARFTGIRLNQFCRGMYA